jgi:predicted dehydrogenase
MQANEMDRRTFVGKTIGAGAALTVGALMEPRPVGAAPADATQKIRVGIIGCGSVSGAYLPHLLKCPFVEVVSACDIIPERAEERGNRFNIPNRYPHIEKMLQGAEFDLLVNTTDMQEHEHLNREAIEAGKHVWSEKPIGNSVAGAQAVLKLAKQKGVRIWGAPTAVNSPQFAFMAQTLAAGKLGRVAAAHADYGHEGPDWSSFFYEVGGGSLPDLGVYNITSLTGLFGPAKSVVAMCNIVTPTREIQGKGTIKVTEEDNAMLILDHGAGVLSHIQSGFNYFNPHGHDGSKEVRHTISMVGSHGFMGLVGYDWAPLAVDLATKDAPDIVRHCTDPHDYVWQQGASLVAECLATGRETLFTAEHSIHVLDIICAARESQKTGRRIELTTTFKWPVVS